MLFGNFQIIDIYVGKYLEKRCREIIEAKLNDTQYGFRPGRSTTDQIFTLKQIFKKSWEHAKDVYTCFVDLEKVYDRVPRENLWGVLWVYGRPAQHTASGAHADRESFPCGPRELSQLQIMLQKLDLE